MRRREWSCDHRPRGHGDEPLKLNIYFTAWREDKNRLKKIIIGHGDVFSHLIFSCSLCFTFAEPFDDIFLFLKSSCALVSGNTNKNLRPKEGSTDRPTDRPTDRSTKRVNSRSLTKLLFRILQNSRKDAGTCSCFREGWSSERFFFFCNFSFFSTFWVIIHTIQHKT